MSDSNLSIRCELVESWRLIRAVAPRVVRLAATLVWRCVCANAERGGRGWR